MPPDDVRVSAPVPGGNGERLEVNLRERTIGLSVKDVLPVLLMVVIGGMGYFLAQHVTAGQRQGFAGLAHIMEKMSAHHLQLLEKLNVNQTTLLELVHVHRQDVTTHLTANNAKVTAGQAELRAHMEEALQEQTALVHSQTQAIDGKVNALEKYIEAWFSEVGRRLEMLSHNIAHPERQLPLRAPVPPEERQPERGR